MQKLVYSTKEAAEILGISRAFLYLLWKHNRGPARTRINSKVLITHNELQRWLDSVNGTVIISEYAHEMIEEQE